MSEVQKKFRFVNKISGKQEGKSYSKFPHLFLKYNPSWAKTHDVVCYTHQLIATEVIEFDIEVTKRGFYEQGKVTIKN